MGTRIEQANLRRHESPSIGPFKTGDRMLLPANYRLLVGLQSIVLTVVALYYGQPILLPLVLATLLTFLLRPAVLRLERYHLPRIAAVGVVVFCILLGMTVVGGV